MNLKFVFLVVIGVHIAQSDAPALSSSPPKLTIQLNLQNGGTGAISGSGLGCPSVCESTFPLNTQVSLIAKATNGSEFVGWSGACSGKQGCTVILDASKTVTATFTKTKLIVTVNGTGTVTGRTIVGPVGVSLQLGNSLVINCPTDCVETDNLGTKFKLTATPSPGAVFESWSGACAGYGTSSCIVELAADKATTANFRAPLVTVALQGRGTGTVSSSPAGILCGSDCSHTYPLNSTVTLNAKAAQGSKFISWSGDCSGSNPVCSLVPTADVNIIAGFGPE